MNPPLSPEAARLLVAAGDPAATPRGDIRVVLSRVPVRVRAGEEEFDGTHLAAVKELAAAGLAERAFFDSPDGWTLTPAGLAAYDRLVLTPPAPPPPTGDG